MKVKSELLKAGIVVLILLNLFNVLNYFFQFFMARMLSVVQYGILATLMGLAYLFNVPAESIQLISSKYTSSLSKKNKEAIKGLLYKLSCKAFRISIFMYFAFIPISFILSWFFNIDVKLILLTGLLIPLTFLAPINRGILQGQKKLKEMGFLFLIEAVVKITIGISLVLIGWGVYGAMTGVVLGLALSFIFSFTFIKDILSYKKIEKLKLKRPYYYSFNVFFTLAIIFTMFSLDVLLARRFFEETLVGIYAIASLLGKTIFFAVTPISKAMFPLTSESKIKDSKKTLINSIKITVSLGGAAVILFFLFPELVIKILFGSKYVKAAEVLGIIGLSFLSLTLINLLSYYLLSLGKVKKIKFLIIFPLLQIILLSFFHYNLHQFSLALLSSFLITLLGLIIMVKNEKD